MSVEVLKNDSRHDNYPVEQVVRDVEALLAKGLGGVFALVDLHRIVTGHLKADKISEGNKRLLIEGSLMKPNGDVSNIVRDVILSTTTGEGLGLNFTPQPYKNNSSPAERAGLDPSDPLAAALNLFSKPRGKGFG